jgi:hypothetical protein
LKSKNVRTNSYAEVCTINVSVSTQNGNSYIEFSYLIDNMPVEFKLDLVQVPSNLGKGGHLWYFLCPQTADRCRKLYLYQDHFVSRKSINGAFYKGQVKSKRMRFNEYDKNFILFHKLTAVILQGQGRYFKRWYKERHTKKHVALLHAVEARRYLKSYFDMIHA